MSLPLWESGGMHGSGEKKCVDGEWYKGEYERFEKHGQGEWVQKDGTHYKGCFAHDKRSGFGVLTHANGDVWSGFRRRRAGWSSLRPTVSPNTAPNITIPRIRAEVAALTIMLALETNWSSWSECYGLCE